MSTRSWWMVIIGEQVMGWDMMMRCNNSGDVTTNPLFIFSLLCFVHYPTIPACTIRSRHHGGACSLLGREKKTGCWRSASRKCFIEHYWVAQFLESGVILSSDKKQKFQVLSSSLPPKNIVRTRCLLSTFEVWRVSEMRTREVCYVVVEEHNYLWQHSLPQSFCVWVQAKMYNMEMCSTKSTTAKSRGSYKIIYLIQGHQSPAI